MQHVNRRLFIDRWTQSCAFCASVHCPRDVIVAEVEADDRETYYATAAELMTKNVLKKFVVISNQCEALPIQRIGPRPTDVTTNCSATQAQQLKEKKTLLLTFLIFSCDTLLLITKPKTLGKSVFLFF